MKRWQRDDLWQKGKRDLLYVPFYEVTAFKGRFTLINKSCASMQIQKQGVDTTFQVSHDESVLREEKLVRWKGRAYTRIFCETDSCTVPGHESEGWMRYTIADELFYGLVQEDEQSVDAYLIKEFQKFKSWFWEMYEVRKHSISLQERYPESTNSYENRTRGVLVYITDVIQVAKVERFFISTQPTWHYEQRPLPEIKMPLPELKLRRQVNVNASREQGMKRAEHTWCYMPRVVDPDIDTVADEDDREREESYEEFCEKIEQVEAKLEEQDLERLAEFGERYERNQRRYTVSI